MIARYRRAVDVHGICVGPDGRTLFVGLPYDIPGGPVDHGEHPADAVVRHVRAQTGGEVEVLGLRSVVTDVESRIHHDRLVFTVGMLSDAASFQGTWLAPAEMARDRLTPVAALVLGLLVPDNDQRAVGVKAHWPGDRVQRFAAYGFATDPAGNVLLTLISKRYPGAGMWHLPGGGTDFGESPAVGLAREIEEETGQHGVIAELMGVSHRYQLDARGPEGRPMDWHGVRVVYRVHIDEPTEPRVLDRGGSTAAARWFTAADAVELSLTEVARDALSRHLGEDR